MTFRFPALLSLAQLAPCCMGCRAPNVGQVVSAHSNQGRDGKGMSLKASDAAIAFICHDCHMHVDQGSAPIEIRTAMWEAAHRATMRWLIESGHLVIAPDVLARLPEPKPKAKAKVKNGRPLKGRGFEKRDTPQKIPSRPLKSRARP